MTIKEPTIPQDCGYLFSVIGVGSTQSNLRSLGKRAVAVQTSDAPGVYLATTITCDGEV